MNDSKPLRYRVLCNFLLAFLNIVVVTHLGLPAANAQAPDDKAPVILEIPDGAKAGRQFDVDQATDAYINLLSEEDRASSDTYMEGGYWLQLWGFLYGLGLAWLLLRTRLSSRMRNFSERIGRWRWLHTPIYGALYILLVAVLSFPLTVYQGFFREHSYQLATQTFGAWLGDELTGLMIGVLMFGVVLTVIYGVIRKARDTWWVWGAGVSVLLLTIQIENARSSITPGTPSVNLRAYEK